MRVAEGPQCQPNRTRNVGGPSKNNGDGYTLTYFLNSVSIAACATASSISDFAPLAAIPPRIRPSTIIGSPPWFGKKFGKASASTLPFFTVRGILGRAFVQRRVPRLLLRELDSVHGRSVALLQEQQIPAVVHNANRHADVALLRFRLRGRHHRLDGGQVQIFLRRQIVCRHSTRQAQQHKK